MLNVVAAESKRQKKVLAMELVEEMLAGNVLSLVINRAKDNTFPASISSTSSIAKTFFCFFDSAATTFNIL